MFSYINNIIVSISVFAILIIAISGCSIVNKQVDNDTSVATSNVTQKDTSKELLTEIMQKAQQGMVIDCEFPVKITVIDNVIKKWGEPDKSDWVPAAKGTYDTFSKHNIVFGFNKGMQIFEVRTYDKRLQNITLLKVKEVYGEAAYTNEANNEKIIGYKVGDEFNILLVFPLGKDGNENPTLDHYSILYPIGTVNSMANDPGREW